MVDGERYDGDSLIPVRQQRASIRYAKWAPEQVLYLPNYPDLAGAAWIPRAKLFHAIDQAGAIEQSRKNGIMRRHLKDLAKQAPLLDMACVVEDHVAALPHAPATPFGPEISLGAAMAAMVESGERMPPPEKQEIRQIKAGQIIDKASGKPLCLADLLPDQPKQEEAAAPASINLADCLTWQPGNATEQTDTDPITLPARIARLG